MKILAFPANNFGKQEPGSNSKIKAFCSKKMNVTFDLFAKVSVVGKDQVPLFRYFANHSNKKVNGEIEWNFEKYLVGRDGTVIEKFGTRTLPQDKKIIASLEKALAKKTD